MGQRELMLMLLASVITGIAIFAGIKIFNNQNVEFEEDEYEQLMLEIGEEMQAWYVKPTQLGGGGKSYHGLNFNQIPCPLGNVGDNFVNCSDDDGKHKIVLTGRDNYHAKIISVLRLKQKIYINGIDVKADTSIILGDWISP